MRKVEEATIFERAGDVAKFEENSLDFWERAVLPHLLQKAFRTLIIFGGLEFLFLLNLGVVYIHCLVTR